MGRKKTTVGTSVSRAIPDAQLPNSVRSGATKALFEGGGIPEYLLEELVASIGVKAERMYSYGRDHYTHGLPSGQFTVAAENIEDVVGTVLLSIENTPVTLDYLHYGAANSLHAAWIALYGSHGYDPSTNQLAGLTATKGTPVYLHDMVVVIPLAQKDFIDPQSLAQWGVSPRAGYTPLRKTGTPESRALIQHTGIKADPLGSTEYVRVEYIWETPAGTAQDSFLIQITGVFDDQADYFHVKYSVGGVTKYWMYKDGGGVYPTLDSLFDHAPLANGSFFPFAYFRYNKVSETANTLSPAYLTSKKLVSYLGMDYDQVAEAIESNPGIADVEQAMLMLAVPANTANELEQRYLWEFFNQVFLASSLEHRYRTEEEAERAALTSLQQGLTAPGIVIQDARFKMSLDNLGIYKRRKAGNIGAPGTYDSSFATKQLTYQVTVESEATEVVTLAENISSHYYRRQISPGYYDEIQVVGLRTVFHILGENIAIGDELDNILMIPLDRAITGAFSIPEREVLYARSLHFVFNSVVITQVKWYETALFQMVLIAVAVVVTIASWGGTTPELIALIAAQQYATATLILMVALVKIMIFREVFRLFTKAVGIEAAIVVAIVAAVMGLPEAGKSSAVAGAPFAMDLLAVSTGLSAAVSAQLQENMAELLKEAAAFEALKEEQTKLLDTARELLENNSFLSPFVIFGEKPGDFYNRTVHSGNIGVVGISAISSFVDQALRLPDLNDSLGDTP